MKFAASENQTEPALLGFDEIASGEAEWIAQRRKLSRHHDPEIRDDEYVGLGLSGGGIRSAVFNLGLLQALERHGIMQQVDYMSTVSGGGYIGSCLTWLKAIRPDKSPFGDSREDYDGTSGAVLSWLRSHGKYLVAGEGLSIWSLIAALLTGTLINLLVLIPPLFLAIYALTRDLPVISTSLIDLPGVSYTNTGANDGFALMAFLGIMAFALFFLVTAFYVVSTSVASFRKIRRQRAMRIWQGRLLMFGVVFLTIGTVPVVHGLTLHWEHILIERFDSERGILKSLFDEMVAGFTFLAGILTLLLSRPRDSKEEVVSKTRRAIFGAGLVLLIYGLFLIGFDLMKDLSDRTTEANNSILFFDESLLWTLGYQISLAVSVLLAIFVNVNEVSMHRYYRNRLMEAFMPLVVDDENESGTPTKLAHEPESFMLHHENPPSDAPYQIINTSVNMVGSDNIKLQGRGADNFILSPLYCGAESTGYAPTKTYVGGTLDLATAFSISGAAVDPNSYATRSRSVSFLMSLLNIRLGYWINNPKYPPKVYHWLSKPRWYVYLLREMLGSGLDENYNHVHLSDGGHFENLGLYELIRRRCRYIIVSDVGADPEYAFLALAKVIEMVRVDFGAKIDLDIAELEPHGAKQHSKRGFVAGKVLYPRNSEPGQIIYVKPVVMQGMPEDIHGYKREHPTFPHESTANQFFGESQFEAYRELGYLIGHNLCDQASDGSIVSLFAQFKNATLQQPA